MSQRAPEFSSHTLVQIFNSCFLKKFNTCLVGGASEPLYVPAEGEGKHARIEFAYDYFASALHEISHWCIAGSQRRQQVDYGYWYAPDGRSTQQQQLFEQVEVKPQALEWIFNMACGTKFRVSADNLNLGVGASETFKNNIHLQVQDYCRQGLPERATVFSRALANTFNRADFLCAEHYRRESLD